MIFVFIGGASASGKSSVAKKLVESLPKINLSAQIVSMDDYFKEAPAGVDMQVYRAVTNFDLPEMMHLKTLQDHVEALNQGQCITKDIFSFTVNKSIATETIFPTDVIIMEGIFAIHFFKHYVPEHIRALPVHITTTSYKNILETREIRDQKERNRNRDMIYDQERKFVGPGFFKYTAAVSTSADIHIINHYQKTQTEIAGFLEKAVEEIVLGLQDKLKQPISGRIKVDAKAMIEASNKSCDKDFQGVFNGAFGIAPL